MLFCYKGMKLEELNLIIDLLTFATTFAICGRSMPSKYPSTPAQTLPRIGETGNVFCSSQNYNKR